jgi:hypothetical protein
VLYTHWDSALRVVDFVDVFQPFFKRQIATSTDPEGNDDRDQLLSLIARWVIPEGGFEAYVEWGRNDHNTELRDFLLEPDHSQAYTIGVGKNVPSDSGIVHLRAEWTHLGRSPTFQVRATPSYYAHHLVRAGYTEKGQILGAGIGPGSDSQYLSVDRYHSRGRWGVFAQRVRFDEDTYYRLYGTTRRREGHNVELTIGGSMLHFVGQAELGIGVELSRELNRHYVIRNDATNLGATLRVRFPLPGSAATAAR